MTFGTSLELFALVWALLCVLASAVVMDSLLKASSPRPDSTVHEARLTPAHGDTRSLSTPADRV